jgi:hypothetical protein
MAPQYSDVVLGHQGKTTDKWSGYLPLYDELLGPIRAEPISLLEIGVQNGGSLEIYERFFPHAKKIVGVDVEERCATLKYRTERVSIVIGDAGTMTVKEKVLQHAGEFDVIIDDGSHKSEDIIEAFLLYFPLLRPGGTYVVEDLSCAYWQAWSGGLFHEQSSIAFFKTLVDLVNAEHWGIKQGPRDLLKHRFPNLRNSIPDDVCNEVFSVSFMNSLAVVTKNSADRRNRIGSRIVVGRDDAIVPFPPTIHGSSISSDETENPWSVFPSTLQK